MRYGSYANVGGFRFQPCDWKSFPIDAKQLHYHVTKGYANFPKVNSTYIHDKNKVDGVLHLTTVVQKLWFVPNMFFRAYQHLVITALELSTAAFVFLGIATSLRWMSNPADVENPDYLRCKARWLTFRKRQKALHPEHIITRFLILSVARNGRGQDYGLMD